MAPWTLINGLGLDQRSGYPSLRDWKQGGLEKSILEGPVGMGTMCPSLWSMTAAQPLSHSKAAK